MYFKNTMEIRLDFYLPFFKELKSSVHLCAYLLYLCGLKTLALERSYVQDQI